MSQIPIIDSARSALQEIQKNHPQTPSEQIAALLHQLNSSFDSLQSSLSEANHEKISSDAERVISLLKKFLAQPGIEKMQRDSLFLPSYDDKFAPLKNLLTLLDNYQNPNFSTPQPSLARLIQALSPAKALVQGETDSSQGFFAGKINQYIMNPLKGLAIETASNLLEQAASSDETKAPYHHPLLQFKKLIAIYKSRENDFLPASRENQLAAALRHLDQKPGMQSTFAGIEAYIYENIPEGDLHKNLDKLVQKTAEFIYEKAQNNNDGIFEYFYHQAIQNGKVGYWSQTNNSLSQKDWSKGRLKDISTLSNSDLEMLWTAAAEYDNIKEIEALENGMISNPENQEELRYNIELALKFFQNYPDKTVLQDVAHMASGWLSLTYAFMSERLERSELQGLEKRLNELNQQLNRGQYVEALSALKDELSKSSPETSEGSSPLKALSQIRTKQETLLSEQKKSEAKNWEGEMKAERKQFVEHVGYISTFKTIYNVIGRPGQPIDANDFQRMSDDTYAAIMKNVESSPQDLKQAVFLSNLKAAIDSRNDLSFYRKMLAKSLAWVILISVRFFTNHFAGSFLNYLTSTVRLPSKKPLGNHHLSPVKRVNSSLISQKKAIHAWASDKEGEKFGSRGRGDALSKALKEPSLNNGYKHDELVNKTTRCAIDKFLNIEGISALLFARQRHLENWTNRSVSSYAIIDKGIYGVKYVISLILHTALTLGIGVARVFEYISSLFLKIFAKEFLVRFGIMGMILDSMKDSLYSQSQYTNAIDQLLLEQLIEVEKILDQPGGGKTDHEGQKTKELFKETVANAFQLIDLNKSSTPEEVSKSQEAPNSILGELHDGFKTTVDEKLRGALVQLLIISYQSILTEEQMNALLLKIFKSTNSSLFPQTYIQRYFSDQEKEEIKKELKREPSDEDLKKKFALEIGKPEGTEIHDDLIELHMKIKFSKTEQELKETTSRIIKKCVHNTVQETGKTALMSAHDAAAGYTDWMDRSLLQRNGLSGSKNFFFKMEQILATESGEERTKQLQKEMLSLMEEYERVQEQLDAAAGGGTQKTKAHIAQLNKITQDIIIKKLANIQEILQNLNTAGDKDKRLEEFQIRLQDFKQSVYQQQAEIEMIKEEELRFQSQGKTLGMWLGEKVKSAAVPPTLDQVENYANGRLEEIANGAFALYKDPNTFDTFLRHVVMLNFVESQGHYKKA